MMITIKKARTSLFWTCFKQGEIRSYPSNVDKKEGIVFIRRQIRKFVVPFVLR